jgi:hypothetical protein
MMTPAARFTRRGLCLTLGGLALAPAAMAQRGFGFPLRVAYARVGPEGFVHLRADEQRYWTELQTRAGGLIETMEPIQPANMLGEAAPGAADTESCAVAARQIAFRAGLSHVILYATKDGRRDYKYNDAWLSETFARFRSEYLKYDRAFGEAHLLGVGGGPAIVSVTADAPPRNPLDPFDNRRNPERETLAGLTAALERRLQSLARVDFEAQVSIAD